MKTLINTGLKAEDIEAIKRVMQQHPGIISVVLYGSRAKGNYRNNSDIDPVSYTHLTLPTTPYV